MAPAGAPLSAAPAANLVAARPSDIELFGKPISTVKPQLGALATAFQPATGPIVPYRIRIPALGIDTVVESVGVTASGLMDVPSNIWDAGWLETGAKPGAAGQAIIDGHLDSVRGSAVFSDLRRLQAGDRVYVATAVAPKEAELKVGLYGEGDPANDGEAQEWRLLALDQEPDLHPLDRDRRCSCRHHHSS